MRCSLTVDNLDDLEKAIETVFAEFGHFIVKCKPKLNSDLKNVTFHMGVPAVTEYRSFIPLIGEL